MQYYKTSNMNFDRNGDIKLQPSSAVFKMELNGDNSIEVEHPYDLEGRWKQIEVLGVIKTEVCYTPHEQLYRIYDIEKDMDSLKIKARHIFFDLANKTILDNRANNVDGQKALDIILQDTNFKGKSNITQKAYCYFVDMSVLSAIKGDKDNTFLSRYGGEIYLDNFNITINDKIGKEAGTIKYSRNMQDISLSENTDAVVTRVIPKAFNGYKLPEYYVDSPLINKYPIVFENFVDLSDLKLREDASDGDDELNIFDTKDQLYYAMREEVKKLYEKGLDKPTLEGNVNIAILRDLEEFKDYTNLVGVGAGDTLKAKHEELEIEIETRCLSLEWNILTKKYNDMTFGDNIYKSMNYFDKQDITNDRVNRILNKNGSVNAETIQGSLDGYSTKLKAMREKAEEQQTKSIIFEDRVKASKSFGALALGTAGFMIADKLDNEGNWIWSTFGTGQGFTADFITTGVLKNKDNSFAIDLNSKDAAKFYNNGQLAMRMNSNALKLFNWGKKNTEEEIGGLISLLRNDSNRNPISDEPLVSLLHETNSAVTIDYRDKEDKTISHSYVDFDKYNNLKSKNAAPIRVNENVEMADNNLYNAHFKANKAIPFYINNKEVMLLNEGKIFLYAPIYNSKGQLVLDPSLTQQGISYQDDGTKNLIDKLISVVKAQLGKKYVWGGEDPNTGFDCSGLMQWSYKQIGINIPRTTYDQINTGTDVKREDLQLGDLVFPSIEHVGMYIGDGKIIHAPHTGDVVKISDIWAFYKARRIIRASATPTTGGGTVPSGQSGNLNGQAGNNASANMIYMAKMFEGFASRPYDDGAGTQTIGYGLIGAELREAESMGLPLTEANATKLLVKYFNSNYYKPCLNIIKSHGVTPTQREADAFADFAYNEGVGAFQESTLLTVYVEYVKGGRKDSSQVHTQLLRWIYAGGAVMQGLKNRRENEYRIITGQKVAGYDTIAEIQNITSGGTIKNGGAKPY